MKLDDQPPAAMDQAHYVSKKDMLSGMVVRHLKRTPSLPFVITFHALGRVRRLTQGAIDGFSPARIRIGGDLMRQADCHSTWRTVARQVADMYATVLADVRPHRPAPTQE